MRNSAGTDMSPKACCSSVPSDFSVSYEDGLHPAVRRMEEYVLGCRYGATSWTTKQQAENIVTTLQLDRHHTVLDIGGGAGWPSLFLASASGCHVTIVDPTANALNLAGRRAVEDGLADNVCVVCGDGTSLPIADRSFDCIVHADVLCCLPDKLELLNESRRVAAPGAKMHFSVIMAAKSLPDAAYREAVENGPPFVDTGEDYADLLQESQWNRVHRTDASDDYAKCMCKLVDYMQTYSEELAAAFGRERFADIVEHRRKQLSLIEKGWLIREVFVAS